jgi:hypothetical protein
MDAPAASSTISVSVVAVSSVSSPVSNNGGEVTACLGDVERDCSGRHDAKMRDILVRTAQLRQSGELCLAADSSRAGLPDRGGTRAPARARMGTDRRHHGHLGPSHDITQA